MKQTPLSPISKKKQHQLREERKIRKLLEERAGGVCEGCGRAPGFAGLHPHEKVYRSQRGKLTMENSVMLCNDCHRRRHGR